MESSVVTDSPVRTPDKRTHDKSVMAQHSGETAIQAMGFGMSVAVAVIVLCMGGILAAIYWASIHIDNYSTKQMQDRLINTINQELNQMGNLVIEYSWWNEAIENVIVKPNPAWAEDNSSYLIDTYSLNWVISFDSSNRMVHGWSASGLIDQEPGWVGTDSIASMLADSIETDLSDPDFLTGLIHWEGSIILVSVAPYVAYEPSELDLDRTYGVLVLARNINQELLTNWATKNRMSEITLWTTPDQTPAGGLEVLPLAGYRGAPVGYLAFQGDQIGSQLLLLSLKWIVPILVVVSLAMVFFYRKLKTYQKVASANLEELEASRHLLYRQANYDFLTGLQNRAVFVETVKREIARCLRHDIQSAVLYIDLDGFKMVNDSLGHAQGDNLLVYVADIFRSAVREEDAVARFGGDEFCVLLIDIKSTGDVDRAIEKIQDLLKQPIWLAETEIRIGLSAGVVMIPRDTVDVANVFRFSDIAMYEAKKQEDLHVCFFDHQIEHSFQYRTAIKDSLKVAIKKNELHLVYQPIYDLKTRVIVGAEALLRWTHDDMGVISPDEFIPFAEENGAIVDIGEWVMEHALSDLTLFQHVAGDAFRLSINVSSRQLRSGTFPDRLEEIRGRYGLSPDHINLDVTETLLFNKSRNAHDALFELTKRGYHLALDDFGTGYTALNHLQRYPLKTIKIDKSFFSETPLEGKAIVKSIVYMAETMGLTTVAEGIESLEQESLLKSLNCTYGQGFLFSRPIRAVSLLEFLRSSSLSEGDLSHSDTSK